MATLAAIREIQNTILQELALLERDARVVLDEGVECLSEKQELMRRVATLENLARTVPPVRLPPAPLPSAPPVMPVMPVPSAPPVMPVMPAAPVIAPVATINPDCNAYKSYSNVSAEILGKLHVDDKCIPVTPCVVYSTRNFLSINNTGAVALQDVISSFSAETVKQVLFQILWTLYVCQGTWQGFRFQTSTISSLFNNINVYDASPRYFETIFNGAPYRFRVTEALPVFLNMNYFITSLDRTSQLPLTDKFDDITDATDILKRFAEIETPAFDIARQMVTCNCTPIVHIVQSFASLQTDIQDGDKVYKFQGA